jgi:hypothetical protein
MWAVMVLCVLCADLLRAATSAGSGDQVTQAAVNAIRATAEEERLEAIRAKKLAKKAAFDVEYDEGGAKGVRDHGEDLESRSDAEDEGDGIDGRVKKKGQGWARCVPV